MSSRELRALLADESKDSSKPVGRTRSSSRRQQRNGDMSEEDVARVAELESALEETRKTVDEQKEEILRAQENERELLQRLKNVEMELDNQRLRAEVEKLRAVEKAREEERVRSEKWAEDLRERFRVEKVSLETRIASLETDSFKVSEAPSSCTGGSTEPSGPPTTAATTTAATTTAATTTAATTPSAGSTRLSTSPSMTVPVTGTTAPATTTSVTHSTSVIPSIGSTDMIMKLFETQSQLLAAQVQAATLPPLRMFDGQGGDDDMEFHRWLERFEERARLARWTDDTKLCQLRLHLTKVADQAYQMLSGEDKGSYTRVVDALKKRFRSVEIEELKGMEFHGRIQGDKSIERLGMDLQKLGRKAFPSIEGKELDRMLKGRFYQALHPRWQRKLNAPRPDETFAQLFERARTLEQHEKQFSASAVYRGESAAKRNKPTPSVNRPPVSAGAKVNKITENSAGPTPPTAMTRLCHVCRQPGHLARECPTRHKNGKHEAPGRSNAGVARMSHLGVQESTPEKDLTEEELERLLARCRLQKEKKLMLEVKDTKDGTVACVGVPKEKPTESTVGPLLYCDLEVEGVPVASMVDCGSQTTIISRALLHKVAQRLKRDGRPPPDLKVPTVRLYGKDGPNGAHQLRITAQVDLQIKANGETITLPVFVQPDSSQECLLGTNAAIPLGFKFTDGKGKPLRCSLEPCSDPSVARVSLVQTALIPSRKGRFLKSRVTGEHVRVPGEQFLFESENSQLEGLGLCTSDSLVTTRDGETVFIPVYNFTDHGVRLPCDTEFGVLEPFSGSTTPPSVESGVCARVLVDGPGYHEEERASKLLRLLDLSKCDCSSEQSGDLELLLSEHSDVFELDRSELGFTNVVHHTINTGGSAPIKQQPYRTPIVQREKIAQLIQEMQQQNIVKPSCSPWASPIVLVPKKDGTTRFCVDYRRLNQVTRKDVYPLPRIDDIIDTLAQAKYFSTLDLSAGYWQVALDTESQSKTAFTTHCGLYEFTRMPFGLCNAPATFQRLMQLVLAGLEWDCCFVYLDDILIASKSFDEHLRHLQLVFQRLRKAGLRLKPRKCQFLCEKVTYLGYIISKRGIEADPCKTDKVKNFPTPSDPTSVRSFVGLASYYRRFVPRFASVAAPLHYLTKKDVPFEWTEECEAAFCKLKTLLTEAPILAYPRFGPGEAFLLETDASGVGLGAVLSQKQDDGHYHPIAYASKSLNPHEKNYAISELETLAIVWAVKKFRAYLLGHPCTVLTDHAACLSLLNTPRPSAKLARWAMAIQEFNLEIKHRSGRTNVSADALSRHPVDNAVVGSIASQDMSSSPESDQSDSIPTITPSEDTQRKLDELSECQQTCPDLKYMFAYLSEKVLPEEDRCARRIVLESRHFDLCDGVLHHESVHFPGTWCVAVPIDLRQLLLEDAHEGILAGHLAEKRVYDRLRRKYWWSGMRRDVRKHCRSCLACASRKGTGRASRPPLHPIAVGGPFHTVGVDILKLPLTYDGNQYVLVFLDYLTKWAEVFPIADQKAETVARLLVEGVICRHGAPERLLSDRGANFLSGLMTEVCRLLQVKKINTSGYHPQTDGLVERFHRTLIQMMSVYVKKHGRDWDRYLPYLYAYRVSAQESVRESPFFLLYGRDPRQPIDEALACPTSPYVFDADDYKSELVRGLSDAWTTAAKCITSAQSRQKIAYDRHSKDIKYKAGDRVMVHMPHECTGKAAKLARPFFGPYRVISATPTNVEVRLIDRPDDPSIFVALSRVRRCYDELPNVSWQGHSPPSRKRKRTRVASNPSIQTVPTTQTGPITRSRAKASVTSD